jgi:hypothetical protein
MNKNWLVLLFVLGLFYMGGERANAQAGLYCRPIEMVASAPMAGEESVQAEGLVMKVTFAATDCEVTEDFYPSRHSEPEIKYWKSQILRRFLFSVVKISSGVETPLLNGTMSMPLGIKLGNTNYFGPSYDDTIQDPTFWETQNGVTVPTIKFQQLMIVQAAWAGLMANQAEVHAIVDFMYEDLVSGGYAITVSQPSEDGTCPKSAPLVIFNPFQNYGEGTVLPTGNELVVRLLNVEGHEMFHAWTGYNNQSLISQADLGYGTPEESVAEAYAWYSANELASNPEFQLLWNFDLFAGANKDELRSSTLEVNKHFFNYYAEEWALGSFGDYMFAPIVKERFPEMHRIVSNLFTHCHEDFNIHKMGLDYGISTSWIDLVYDQVADCLSEGPSGLYRSFCAVKLFAPGLEAVYQSYRCFFTGDESHKVSVQSGAYRGSLLYGVPEHYSDWFEFHQTSFVPSNSNAAKFCILTGSQTAVFTLEGKAPTAVYLPAIQRASTVPVTASGEPQP